MRRENFKDFYTPQVDERDCGVAALNMVLKSTDLITHYLIFDRLQRHQKKEQLPWEL